MAVRKRIKKQTLAEFRAWLDGVEELQSDDWAPDSGQWKLIREKIDGIIEPKATIDMAAVEKLLSENRSSNVVNNAPQQSFAQPTQFIPPSPPVGGVPSGPVEITPAAKHFAPVTPMDLTDVAKPRDTSEGGKYNSGFV